MFYNILAKRSFNNLNKNFYTVIPLMNTFSKNIQSSQNNFSTKIPNSRNIGLDKVGIISPSAVHHNLSYPDLFKHEVKNNEGTVVKAKYGDTFAIDTGKFTGRSPSDKWIVKNLGSESDKNIWWGSVNQPTSPEVFERLEKIAVDHFNTLDECYVFDGYCGANPSSRKKVRFIHEMAWAAAFCNKYVYSTTSASIIRF